MNGNKTCLNRIMISALSSASGKTTLTCGIIEVLKRNGKKVVSYKCGPDYIDPMFHRQVLGIESGNLDTYFTDDDTTKYILWNGSHNADITIIEGAMGFYDGLGGCSTKASAYELAQKTATPVILVIDGKGSSVTLAAVINGIKNYRKDSNIKGIILNRVSKGYYPRIREVIERECDVPVIGYLPVLNGLQIPSRHLGLIAPDEMDEFDVWIKATADTVAECVDLDAILDIASAAEQFVLPKNITDKLKNICSDEEIKIAVARDEAFSFYYTENIDILERLGVKPIYFSPLNDKCLPDDVSGLILWGGYPENYAQKLSMNEGMRKSIYEACSKGMPCIAECGGFLYLGKSLEGSDGKIYDMTGVLEGRGYRTDRLVRFGYMEAEACEPEHDNKSLLLGDNCHMRGHEFHYWDSTCCGEDFEAWKTFTPDKKYKCMVHTESIIAGFPHFYYYSNPNVIQRFVEKCKEFRDKNDR